MKTERLDMRIPASLKTEAIAVANMEKRSLSNLIEVLLNEAVEQKRTVEPRRFKEFLAVAQANGKELAPHSKKKARIPKEKDPTADDKAA